MNRCAIAILKSLLLAALFLSTAAEAQFPPGGGGSGRQRGGGEMKNRPERTPERPAARSVPASDPIAAIHRELPSLRIDMKIGDEQLPAWNAFAAGVRQVNDITQTRLRRAAAAPVEGETPPPVAAFIGALLDEDVQRLEAMRELKSRTAALVDVLTVEQRKMFDRRIAQSQREPLGN